MSVRVRIDGVETTLTFDQWSGSRGYQYLTPGAAASHAFSFKLEDLEPGSSFRTNGHTYLVL
jgi:hypothetical protein